MALSDVSLGDPHVDAHNLERHSINALLDLVNTGRLSVDTILSLPGYLRIWPANAAVNAGDFFLSPNGQVIQRTSSGTTRSTYDSTEAAAWTVQTGSSAIAAPTFSGVNKQSFALADLTSPSGLTVSGGKIKATSAGTNGTATIPLGFTLDYTRPFRIGCKLTVNDVNDTNLVSVRVGQVADDQRGPRFRIQGGSAGAGGGAEYYLPLGSGASFGRTASSLPTLGTKEFGALGVGNKVDFYARPAGIRAGQQLGIVYLVNAAANGGLGPGFTYEGVYSIDPNTVTNYTGTTLSMAGITTIVIENASVNNTIDSIWVEQLDVIAPTFDYTSHFWHRPNVSANLPVTGSLSAATVANVGCHVIGKGHDGKRKQQAILALHPNNSNELCNTDSTVSNTPNNILEALRDYGYHVVFVNGDASAALTAAAVSSWGSPYGRAARLAAVDYVRGLMYSNLATTWGLWGTSMGLLDGLLLHRYFPGRFKAIAGISGVTSIANAYVGAGSGTVFKTQIDTAWGSTTQAAVDPFDPVTHPSFHVNTPIRLWHGTSDTTVPKAQHADAFATAVNALTGGNVTVTAVTGGGHLDATDYNGIDAMDFANFFRSNLLG